MNISHKNCCRCNQSLPLDQFAKLARNNDGYYSWCKKCHSIYQKAYYKKNKEKVQKRNRVVRQTIKRKRTLFILEYLKTHGCVDCGESNPVCLDFDHVRGQKFSSISDMIQNTYSENNILQEISKCEVRCANCHRIKTAKEYNWYDYIDFSTMTIKN